MLISKQIEWDMGHRVLNHISLCKNLHGHRYKAEIILEGDIVSKENDSSEGMLMDFSDVKKLALELVCNELDHGFMVWNKDKILLDFFKKNPYLKHIIVPFTPTAENISNWIFQKLEPHFQRKFRNKLKLNSIKLWETPTSYAQTYKKISGE